MCDKGKILWRDCKKSSRTAPIWTIGDKNTSFIKKTMLQTIQFGASQYGKNSLRIHKSLDTLLGSLLESVATDFGVTNLAVCR